MCIACVDKMLLLKAKEKKATQSRVIHTYIGVLRAHTSSFYFRRSLPCDHRGYLIEFELWCIRSQLGESHRTLAQKTRAPYDSLIIRGSNKDQSQEEREFTEAVAILSALCVTRH